MSAGSSVRAAPAHGSELDQLSINTIRMLAADAVQEANSGHPGAPMGAAAMAYVLWTRILRHNPADPHWPDRDRFVLSAGHASMLLYALLHLTGYELSLDEIRRFRQWGSKTPGHPEYRLTPGVEATTGPLGQGFANGVGMAIAERILAARFNKPDQQIVDHYTYAIVSDGDLQEGVASEAASFAGNLGLGKLIYLYDDNDVQLDGPTSLAFSEDVEGRFAAYGWHTRRVPDGNDLADVEAAIREAQQVTDRPSLLLVRTTIGYGSPGRAGTSKAHGEALGDDELKATKENLGWPVEPRFLEPPEAIQNFRSAVARGQGLQVEWQQRFQAYAAAYPEEAAKWRREQSGELPPDWDSTVPSFAPSDGPMATRAASGRVLTALMERVEMLVGGSADLSGSTNTNVKDVGVLSRTNFSGRNIYFGVREHAMGASANGMSLHGGLIPFTGTFLTFSDYMRGAIRLASLTEIRVIFVFTHDSIGLGEDGPTHQPVEHLVALRAIPELVVLRPADANEVAEAWRVALERPGPTTLVFSRQALPIYDRAIFGDAKGVHRGGYVLAEASGGAPSVILISTGSEVAVAMTAREQLEAQGVPTRVVSLPSWELFDEQPAEYRDAVLPPSVRARVSIEAGVTLGWSRYVTDDGAVIGLDRFGASAPASVLYRELGFTPEHVVAEALRVLQASH